MFLPVFLAKKCGLQTLVKIYNQGGLAGHRGPVGLCTCIIPGGQGFKSRRRQVPSIQFLGGDGKWKPFLKHQFHVEVVPSNKCVYWRNIDFRWSKKELSIGEPTFKKIQPRGLLHLGNLPPDIVWPLKCFAQISSPFLVRCLVPTLHAIASIQYLIAPIYYNSVSTRESQRIPLTSLEFNFGRGPVLLALKECALVLAKTLKLWTQLWQEFLLKRKEIRLDDILPLLQWWSVLSLK